MSKTRNQINRLRGTTKRLAEVIREARADVAKVEAREELTPEAKQAAIAARNAELSEQIEAISEDGRQALEAVRAAAPARPKVDPMEAMRIWARLERDLNSSVDPVTLATRLAEGGDRDGLAVLSEELPSYLRAKDVSPESMAAEVSAVSEAEALLGGDLAEYRTTLAEAEDMGHRLGINAGLAQQDGITTELLVGATSADNVDLSKDVD